MKKLKDCNVGSVPSCAQELKEWENYVLGAGYEMDERAKKSAERIVKGDCTCFKDGKCVRPDVTCAEKGA